MGRSSRAIDARRRALDSTKPIVDVDGGSGGDVVDDGGVGSPWGNSAFSISQ
jgi:hypothetical protein